ncbi:hypothetical protein HK096_009299, partial [Nowakowskiella sp. JEL0078]
MVKLFRLGIFALFISGVFSAPATAASSKVSFVLAGDSTTASDGGWGDNFCALALKGSCFNGGHNGATTVSFVTGGYWAKVLSNLKTFVNNGDKVYVTIQFGHNDQKSQYGFTLATFASNLTSLANQVKSAGGIPVIVTSLTRRSFDSKGVLADTLQPWAGKLLF